MKLWQKIRSALAWLTTLFWPHAAPEPSRPPQPALPRRWRIGIVTEGIARHVVDQQLGLDLYQEEGRAPGLFLGDPQFNGIDDPNVIREKGRELVIDIGAAVAVADARAGSVGFADSVFTVLDDGTLGGAHHFMRAETGVFAIAWCSLDGTSQTRPVAQRALELIRADPEFGAAAKLYATAGEDFRLLYVVLEFIRDAAGGVHGSPWTSLKSASWAPWPEINRFKDVTNNLHRHRPMPTGRTMSGSEARSLIGTLLCQWVDAKIPA